MLLQIIIVWDIFEHLKVCCDLCQVEQSLQDKSSVNSVIASVLHNVIMEMHSKIRKNESTNCASCIYFHSFTAQIHFRCRFFTPSLTAVMTLTWQSIIMQNKHNLYTSLFSSFFFFLIIFKNDIFIVKVFNDKVCPRFPGS